MSTMAEAEDVKQYVEDQLEGQGWVRKILVDKDDIRGYHVGVWVDNATYKTSGHKVPTSVNEVPIMLFLVG